LPHLPSMSIDEFCALEGISRPAYFAMRAKGQGPDEMHHGNTIRISSPARDAWQVARAHPVGQEALARDQATQARTNRARRAGRAGRSA
jgi:hypothetical protein